MNRLHFGTAGIPRSTPQRSTEEGIRRVQELGLDNMELEFVHSVYLNEETAKKVNVIRKQTGILLTAHAPYYINLNAKEPQKKNASMSRILKTARIAHITGADSITFHAGYYLGMEKTVVYETIKQHLKEIVETLQAENNKVWIRPELTGKPTQFGDLKELLKLSTELDQVMPCIDFAHQHARNKGAYNSYPEFVGVLEEIEQMLGKQGLHNMHIHISGIHYGEKGERHHLVLKESDFCYTELLKACASFGVRGVVVCESPNIEEDALLLKKTYASF